MSATIPVQQYVSAVSTLRGQYDETRKHLQALTAENIQQVKELEGRAESALAELTAVILPTLDPAALTRAVDLTGYVPLVQNDPLAALDKARQSLSRRAAEIEVDRRYRDRMLLRAPRIGMLTREIAELEEFRAPLDELLGKCVHERLDHLLQVGYGTSAYNVPFWRLSFYSDWQAGDQICGRLGGTKPFAELRTELLAVRETITVYDTKLAKLREEVRLGESLEFEHDEALRKIDGLPQESLANLRGQLGSYLRDIDLVAIGDRLAREPQIDGMAKRYLGLSKQTSYLRDSGQHLLKNTVAPVEQTISSLDREIVKYQRPKLAYTALPAERMSRLQQMVLRNTKSRQQSERYRQTSVVVYSFDDYRYGRLDDDFLWWDLMAHSYSQRYETPTKIYGNFIPEVADFRASHPDYRYQSSSSLDLLDDAESRAAAASLSQQDDGSSASDIS